jgi:hypothetical protein
VPFVRFSRDKRGYENFFLIDSDARGHGGKETHRILYWFRTPPNVKVGRKPFDDRATHDLEAANPGVTFDWETLRNTPIPPVQPEYWRERRRAERAARQADVGVESDESSEETAEPEATPVQAVESGPGRRRRHRRRRGDRPQAHMGSAGRDEQTEQESETSASSDAEFDLDEGSDSEDESSE